MMMAPSVEQLIQSALAEDIGSGDLTALYFVPAEARSQARMVAREPGVVAGMEVAQLYV